MLRSAVRYETILVVEDNPDDVLLLKHMFGKARLLNEVQDVATAKEAICYLKGEGKYQERERYPFPVLIFLDLHLSHGSGFEVLEWVRRNPQPRVVGVVVLTGSDIGAIKRSYQLGADSFLVKPLTFEHFENMVRGLRGLRLEHDDEGYYLRFEV